MFLKLWRKNLMLVWWISRVWCLREKKPAILKENLVFFCKVRPVFIPDRFKVSDDFNVSSTETAIQFDWMGENNRAARAARTLV